MLAQIEQSLKEQNLNTNLLYAKDTGLQLDVLTVQLKPDFKGREQVLTLSFYPNSDTGKNTQYLQLFYESPVEFTEQSQVVYLMMLPYLNIKSAIGHYGFNFNNSTAYFKYTFITDEYDLRNTDKLLEVIELIHFTLGVYQPVFQMIETGATDVVAILAKIDEFYQ